MSARARTRPESHGSFERGTPSFAFDARLAVLALLVAQSTFNPAFMYRQGAVLILILAAPNLVSHRLRGADLWAIAFAGLFYASLQWSVSPKLTTAVFQNQVAVAIVFIALRSVLKRKRALILIAFGYLGGCLYGLWSLMQQHAGAQLSLEFDVTNRYSLDGLNANYTAYSLAAGVGVAVMVSHVNRRVWLAALMVAAAAYAGIGLTGSRGGAVAVFATAAWWWLVPSRFRRWSIWAVYAPVIFISLGILTGWTDDLARNFFGASAVRDTGDLNGRLALWPIAREAFNHRFWLGWGGGSFPAQNAYGVYAHNVLLDLGSGLGFLGLVVFLLLVWTTLFTGTRNTESSSRALLIGTALCCLAPPMLTGYWFQSPAAWVTLALFSRMEVLRSRDKGTSPSPSQHLIELRSGQGAVT